MRPPMCWRCGTISTGPSAAVEQARADFAAAVSAVPGDATLSETQDIHRDAARDYLASTGEVVQDQGCR